MGTTERVIQVQQSGTEMLVRFKLPSYGYCEHVMRANCFPELWELFRRSHSPLKEISESYAAFQKVRKTLRDNPDTMFDVIHVGDGAHARTAAMFAFMSPNTMNYAVDPRTNLELVRGWRDQVKVERFYALRRRIEEHTQFMSKDTPKIITFVHAHVNVDEVLETIPNWVIAYSSACCYPERQRTKKYKILEQGADWRILSEKREYQVISNNPKEG